MATILMNGCSAQSEEELTLSAKANTFEKYFDQEWALNEIWDDGLAEVAIYDARRVKYGIIRECTFTFATVKEHFNKAYNVKTDDYEREDLFEVMKLNVFGRVETDNYPYHFLTSVFIKRNDPSHLFKMTNSSQEWCGNTFKEFSEAETFYSYQFNSYFDGEGKGVLELPKDVMFEDQLPIALRSLKFEEGLTFGVKIIESQISNRAKTPTIYDGEISVTSSIDTIKNIVGENESIFDLHDLWLITVTLTPDKINKYWFSKAYPHFFVKFENEAVETLLLKAVTRYAYWKRDR